jgi:uncharacterized protein (DUF2062 family)
MLFKRRTPEPFGERLRTWAWPRHSFGRSLTYYAKRILRLRGTPHAVAAGVAVGVFIAFLPLPGIHLLIAAALSWLVAGNVVASAFGTTVVGNPLTWPAIWASTYALGHFVLGGPAEAAEPHFQHMFHHMQLAQLWRPLLEPMLIGALPLGLIFAFAAYGLTRWGMTAFHRRRRARLARRTAQTDVAASDHPSSVRARI